MRKHGELLFERLDSSVSAFVIGRGGADSFCHVVHALGLDQMEGFLDGRLPDKDSFRNLQPPIVIEPGGRNSL